MALVEDVPPAAARYLRGHLYVRPTKPIVFPTSSEDYVGETRRHLDNRTALYLALQDVFAGTATIGSDQFVYWNPKNKKLCLCPDIMVKLGVPDSPFDVWNTWEGGTLDLGVEIVSKSDLHDHPWEAKLERYKAAAVREVVRFDRENPEQPLRIWDRVDGELVERAAGDRSFHSCRALGLWWTIATKGKTRVLRLARDQEGADLLATPSEARLVAELARREAEKARRKAERQLRKADKERAALAAENAALKAALARAQARK